MSKIYHLHQLPLSQLICLAENFRKDEKVYITEKVDGSNLSICVVNDLIFLKTKRGDLVRDPQVFVDLEEKYKEPLYQALASFLKLCLLREYYIVSLFKKHKVEQVFFEFVYCAKPNIISYNADLVGPGACYFFDQSCQIPAKELKALLSPYQYYSPNVICGEYLDQFVKGRLAQLIGILSEQGAVLKSRKRDQETVRKKTASIEIIKDWHKSLKKEVLTQIKSEPSCLGGNEIEGVVITCGDVSFKVVDLDDFGQRREEEWQSKDQLTEVKKQFRKDLIEQVFDNCDILLLKNKQISCIQSIGEAVPTYAWRVSEFLLTDIVQEMNLDPKDIILEKRHIFNNICNQTLTKLLQMEIDGRFLPQAVEFINTVIHLKFIFNYQQESRESYFINPIRGLSKVIEEIIGLNRLKQLQELAKK